jgi:hypothetical protein
MSITKRLKEKWQRVQSIAFYKAECLQKVIREVTCKRAAELRSEQEEAEQEQEREQEQKRNEKAGGSQDGDTEGKQAGKDDEQEKKMVVRKVTCTGPYCMIMRQLGSEYQLRIGKMASQSQGCTKCYSFRRTRKMVTAVEKEMITSKKGRQAMATLRRAPNKSPVEDIAKAVSRRSRINRMSRVTDSLCN